MNNHIGLRRALIKVFPGLREDDLRDICLGFLGSGSTYNRISRLSQPGMSQDFIEYLDATEKFADLLDYLRQDFPDVCNMIEKGIASNNIQSPNPRDFIVSPDSSSKNKSSIARTLTSSFDIFLCHNNTDKLAVRQIGEELEKHGVKVWLDDDDLSAGRWDEIFKDLLPKLRSVAIFIGKNGYGREQRDEVRAFKEWNKEYPDFRIIPVILKGGVKPFQIDPLLSGLISVDFNKDYPDPIEQLIRYIG